MNTRRSLVKAFARLLLLAAGMLSAASVSAYAYWTGRAERVEGIGRGDMLGAGRTPVATATGSTVEVTWAASTFDDLTPAPAYLVTRSRIGSASGPIEAGGTCAGPVAATACIDSALVDGSWTYFVTPAAGKWRGQTSPASAPATVRSAAVVFTTSPRTFTAGTDSDIVTVERRDASGVATTVGARTVTVTSSDPTAVVTPATVVIADGSSSASFRVRSERAGTYTLTANSNGLAGATQSATVVAAAPVSLSVVTDATDVSAGTAMSPAPQVRAVDRFGNTSTSFAGSVSLVAEGAPAPGASGAPGAPMFTAAAVDGVARFDTVAINRAGTYRLAASSGTMTPALGRSFTVSAGSPSRLVVSDGPAATITAGEVFSAAVRVEDAFGNAVASPVDGSVALSLDGDGAGVLGGVTSGSSSNGVITFNGLTVERAGANRKLIASAPGLGSASSAAFSVRSAAASQVLFVDPIADTVAGAPLAPVRLSLRDRFGNAASESAQVRLSLGVRPADSVLTGPLSANTVDSVATFDPLVLTRAGSHQLVASVTLAGGDVSATSGAFNVINAAPARLLIGQQPPTTATAGSVLAPAVTVRILDSYDNLVSTGPGATLPVSVNAGSSGAVLSGVLAANAVDGVATFGDLTLTRSGTTTLVASAPSVEAATTSPVNVVAAAPSRLRFNAQPGGAVAGSAMAPVAVEIVDAFGNLTPSSSNVTLTLISNAGPVPLSGVSGVAAPAVNGTAMFSSLVITKAGSYTLAATSDGLAGDTSAGFVVSAAAPAKLVVAAQPPASIVAGATLPAVSVSVQDAFGNAVNAPANVTVALGAVAPASGVASSTSAAATLGGTISVPAAAGGATFDGLVIQRAGTYSLTFTAPGLTSVTSQPFSVVGGTAARLQLVQCQVNGATTPCGTTFALGNQGGALSAAVDVVDQFGNAATAGLDSLTGTVVSADTSRATVAPAALTFSAQGRSSLFTVTRATNAAHPTTVTVTVGSLAPLVFTAAKN